MSGGRSPITTHVLDTSLGRPAAGVAIELYRVLQSGNFLRLGYGETDADGRLAGLVPARPLATGTYRLDFAVGAYFAASGRASFYPAVSIHFEVAEPAAHYHVPLLISPFGYSTYRGS
jgi:5-hydroxyisourate hydrolase